MEWLIALLVILVLVTLVGHGIWVFMAWIFRGGTRRAAGPSGPLVRVCSTCDRLIPPHLPSCPWCAVRSPSVHQNELNATAAGVRRLFDEGLLDAAALQQVLGAIERRRQGLTATPPSEAVPVVPIESPASTPPPLPPVEATPATPAEATTPFPAGAFFVGATPASPVADAPEPAPAPVAAFTAEAMQPAGAPATALPPPPTPAAAFAPPPLPSRRSTPPRRPWSEVLASFMEQKNIRWGELVGGLLIVGCSVALVLSFWAEISQRPILKFSIFTAVTGALFGLGLYTEHKWKLPTTSRGILLIATLLVPLNFLAFAAFSQSSPASDLIPIAGEVVAVGLFLWLLHAAAKVIAPQWPWLLTAGVLSLSATSLVVRYALPAAGFAPPLVLLALAAIPLLCYVAAGAAMLARARRLDPLDAQAAEAVLLFLGVVTFAAVFPFALLVLKSGDPLEAVRRLAPVIGLGALPALASGLLVWRRVEADDAAKLRTAGSAVAVLGVAGMLAAVALAWPLPAAMLPTAIADCILLAALAFAFRVPAGHWLAAACALLAYLLGFHLIVGHVGWAGNGDLFPILLLPSGGTALVGLVLLVLAAVELLRRLGRDADAKAWLLSAAGTAVVSTALAALGGFGRTGDPYGVTWLFAAYAAAAFAVGWRWRHVAGGWAGWAMLLAAAVQWLTSHDAVASTWSTGLLAYATAGAAVAFGAGGLRRDLRRLVDAPARAAVALASAVLVLLLTLATLSGETGAVALRTGWLAALWLAIAIVEASPAWFAIGQPAAAAAVVLGVLDRLEARRWFRESAWPWADPWTWQAVGIALGLLGVGWGAARLLVGRIGTTDGEADARAGWLVPARALARRAWTVDRIVTLLVGLGLLGVAVYAVAPGVAAELSSPGAAVTPLPAAAHAAGVGSWLLLGLMLAVAAGLYREGFRSAATQAAMGVAWAACPLLAARAGGSGASALRWAAAAYLAAAAAAAAVSRRGLSDAAKQVLLAFGVAPVVLLSVWPAFAVFAGEPVRGPAAGSAFARMGPIVSYGVPLGLTCGLLIAQAVRLRSSRYAVAALLALDLTATVTYLVHYAAANGVPIQDGGWLPTRVIHVNAAATGAFGLLWLAALGVDARRRGVALAAPRALNWSLGLAAIVTALTILAPATLALFVGPVRSLSFVAEVTEPWGWAALALNVAAVAWTSWDDRERLSLANVAYVLFSVSVMPALIAVRWDTGNWLAFHTWMGTQTAAACATLGLGWWLHRSGQGVTVSEPVVPATLGGNDAVAPAAEATTPAPVPLEYHRPEVAEDDASGQDAPAPTTVYVGGQDVRTTAVHCAGALGGVVVLLALRAMFGDPAAPWWSVGSVTLIALLTTAVATWLLAPGYLYGSALLFNLAATLFTIESPWQTGTDPLLTLLQINVIALALPAVAWLVLELQVFARSRQAQQSRGWPPVHRAAAVLSAVAVAVVPLLGLGADFAGRALPVSPLLTWAALVSAVALMAACLWDHGARFAPAGLYALGLVAVATALDALNLPPQRIAWAGALLLACYGLLTSGVWRTADSYFRKAGQTAGPALLTERIGDRLAAANLLLAVVVLAAAFWADFTFASRPDRMPAALAALSQAAAVGMVARVGRSGLRRAALAVAAAAAVAVGWAWMEPGGATSIVSAAATHRGAVAVAVLSAAAVFYGVGLRRLFPAAETWAAAGRRVAVPVGGFAVAAMLLTLAIEVAQRVSLPAPMVPMHPAAIAVLAAAFAGWCAAALYWALVPQRDPLLLGERGRMGYVYVAEALAAMGYLHLKLTCPHLLPARLQRFWPLFLMGVAFAAVGLGEVFRRRGRRVLYEPFERTGAFLPLLLVSAFWLAPSEAHYSGVLLAAGAVYALLSLLRRSFAFALMAALAGNAALWYLLHQTPTLSFFSHPQLWVIPAALSVLAAGELNKPVLSAAQLRGLRYVCLVAVYVSSTGDIFLNGVAHSPWLPLVLAGLSVAGVLVGVSFRIRPFLFLGTGFLALAVVAMIWNAAENLHWTWLWYVAGIVLGLMILALFALFEKKREEMLALVEGLKAWE